MMQEVDAVIHTVGALMEGDYKTGDFKDNLNPMAILQKIGQAATQA